MTYGGNSLSGPNLMEVKGSKAEGRHREAGSEGRVEQRYGPKYKNPGMKPRASDESATDDEVRIHPGRWR